MKSVNQFTQIVWKGVKGKKVGFGIKGVVVYAWYCPTGNVPDDATTFKANVFEAGNPGLCISDTVNQCYNKKQINYQNDLRIDHGSPDLVFDHETAKAAQAVLDKN